jgi:hypothetical protein
VNDEEWKVKIDSWREEIASRNLSPRQYSDAWAELMRPRNIELLDGQRRLGWSPPADAGVCNFRLALNEMGFELAPKSGWEALWHELDLIFIAMPDVTDERTVSNAELAKNIDRDLQKLDALKQRFYKLNHSIEFSTAAMMSKADVWKHIPNIEQMIKSLETVRIWLTDNVQAPRWRGKAMRDFRVELAIKITTIFEREFGTDAKPDGGSEMFPIEESNLWTKFYQACALVRIGERASPDRQAVLWEAYKNY